MSDHEETSFFRTSAAAAIAATIPADRLFAQRYRPLQQVPPDIDAITGGGRQIALKGSDVADLAARLRGHLLLGGDEGYDNARRVLNPSFDKHPALIAQVTGTADVRSAVDFARENDLLVAVKCGGHSASGKSTCDRGMMIDLSTFRDVRIDAKARRAWVTGGSLLGQLDHEAMSHDLVTTMGTVSHTGVGGLVTGGGFGRVGRRFGLSIDNLLSVDVVAADGQVHHASEDENQDLFWGVRGGSGNFGVVTSFEFRLHPMQRSVVAGRVFFPIAKAHDVVSLFSEFSLEAPDELDLSFALVHPPGGAPGMAGFSVCYSGRESEAERALAPIRRLGTPMVDAIQAMDYVALQRSGDVDDPRARASYLKSGFINEFPTELVRAIVDGMEGHPDRTTILAYQQGGGAIGRVANDATAFSYRDTLGNLLNPIEWRSGDDGSQHIAWQRQYWSRIEPFIQGFYNNDGEPDATDEAFHANYGFNYERLVGIKNRYDPTNLFRLNANIEPTA